MTSNAQTRTLTPVETHGASDLRGHEPAQGRIRRLADTMGQREQGQDQLSSKKTVKS